MLEQYDENNCLVVELLRQKKKIIAFCHQPKNKNDPHGSIFIGGLIIFLKNFNNSVVFCRLQY